MLNRHVELNPDPHFHSSRPEWCYVHYDPVYDPSQAFQLKLQWMVTTTNLLSTQVSPKGRDSLILLIILRSSSHIIYILYLKNFSPIFMCSFFYASCNICFVHPQIQSWVHKASMCDFNLVAVPMHKSLLQDHRCTHPFRKPSFVPLSLPAEVEEKWRGGGWRATLFAYCCIAIIILA